MTVAFSQALNAYQAQAKMLQGLGDAETPDVTSGNAGGGSSFAQMLSQTLGSTANAQHTAETAQLQSLSGKGDLTNLVTAITNAELTLDTIVAVRDKVISAYQSIVGMPI